MASLLHRNCAEGEQRALLATPVGSYGVVLHARLNVPAHCHGPTSGAMNPNSTVQVKLFRVLETCKQIR